MLNISKLLDSERVTLEGEDIAALKDYINGLKGDAECVRAYRAELLQRLEDGLRAKGVVPDYDTAKSVADKLSIGEIRALLKAAQQNPAEKPTPQLCCTQTAPARENTLFRI